MNTSNIHTTYILRNDKDEFSMFQYAPNQSYTGRKDSDQYACALGVYIDEPTHNLQLNTVVKCHRVIHTASGLHTIKELQYTIVAIEQYHWDMSKPLGQRKTVISTTPNFYTFKYCIKSY